ncbi:tetratricopeptide repeat protein [Roseateles amylovorans]|uniref:Tetratricopeptide repeat protein n=1 Tax=Roseateles amylovorans TaxID=2978473 RepID=A0ABY6B8F8_9BURK|nr:tetratricopeptide repeat protein [Roseateles amylovorans]UXH80663.1 tetratricopeptide repeat protein [Roseateles amylovorans]
MTRQATMTPGRWFTPAATLVVAMVLAGCSTLPPPNADGTARDTAPVAKGPVGAFEAAHLQRAQDMEKQGQLAEAALSWEVLTLLRPDNASYRDSQAALRKQIETAVADRLQRGQQAQKKGDLEGASNQYLTALALQPDNAPAAEALRAIEKERNRRTYLGTPSRITLRRGTTDGAAPKAAAAPKAGAKVAAGAAAATPSTVAPAAAGADRNELEHIAMLSAQGEVDEAIAQLEKRSAQDKRDPSARRLLADLYVRKAERVATTDRTGGINWLQKCLKIDPKHARATTLMRQWIDASAGPATASGGGGTGVATTKQNKR